MGSRNRFGKPDPIKPSPRVTDNMSEFVTKGKLTETEKRRQGSKDSAGRRYLRRDGDGTGRRVPISGGTDAKRKTIVTRNRKAHKRYSGGVNPQVTSAGERKKLERRGAGTQRSRYSGGRRVSVTPGATPITKGDGIRGGKSDPQGRHQRSLKSTNRGPTQRGKEFEVGPHAKVTTGKGKRYRSGYMTNKVRGVDPPKGPSRVFEKGPHKRRGNPEGETRVTQRGSKGSTRGGSRTGQGRYSSGTANATGARRTGGGKTPITGAGQTRSGGGKGGFNIKSYTKGTGTGAKGSIVQAVGMIAGEYVGKKVGAYLGNKLGKAIKSRIKPGTIHPKKSQFMMGKNGEWVRRKVAGLPSGYKESEKKAFKQTKKWNKVNRKKL